MCAARIFTGLDDNAEHAKNQASVVEVARRLASIWLYRNTTLPSNLPRHPAAAYRRGDLLPQPLFDYRPPRHQTESPWVASVNEVDFRGEIGAAIGQAA